ncbi:hypothetical protein L1049_000501 [Liquidambar formosana]|uniref:Disease resistance N-terminal domain-containing protein n=1 Tax=Liquidambar formosana TaxID=63359 RepID=A0AAP0R4U7_LIQFO
MQAMASAASIIVSPTIDTLRESVSSLIKERYLSIAGVKEDVVELSSSLTRIKAVLQDAEEKQLKDQATKDWLRKLKDAAYDAEDVLDFFKTEADLWKRRQQAPSPLS